MRQGYTLYVQCGVLQYGRRPLLLTRLTDWSYYFTTGKTASAIIAAFHAGPDLYSVYSETQELCYQLLCNTKSPSLATCSPLFRVTVTCTVADVVLILPTPLCPRLLLGSLLMCFLPAWQRHKHLGRGKGTSKHTRVTFLCFRTKRQLTPQLSNCREDALSAKIKARLAVMVWYANEVSKNMWRANWHPEQPWKTQVGYKVGTILLKKCVLVPTVNATRRVKLTEFTHT